MPYSISALPAITKLSVSRRNLLRACLLSIPSVVGLTLPRIAGAADGDVNIEIIDAVSNRVFTAFAPGVTRPLGLGEAGGTNVGPRVPLNRHDGDITIAAGQVVSGLDIYGRVTFTGAGVLRDCVVRGWTTAQYSSLTSPVGIISGPSFNLNGGLIEWCRIDATGRESLWANGISGGNYTARYSEILRTNDGISGVQVGKATVECCRIWKGYYTAWHDDATGGALPGWPSSPTDHRTHGDAIQIHQFSGWVIRGCNIGGRPIVSNASAIFANRDPNVASQAIIIEQIDQGTDFPNAGIFITVASTAKLGVLVESNWFQGAAARVNMSTSAVRGDNLSGVTLRGNRFIRSDWSSPGYYVHCDKAFAGTMSDNVFDDNGVDVTVNRY